MLAFGDHAYRAVVISSDEHCAGALGLFVDCSTASSTIQDLVGQARADILATCKMAVFAQSRNMSEGKFTRPPDEREPKPDPPKRQPLLKPKLQSSFQETNEIELPPWLQDAQAQPVSTSPGREFSVKFALPKQKSPRKKRRRNATLYDAVAGRNSQRAYWSCNSSC